MKSVPRALYSRDIIKLINELIDNYNAIGFFSLDEIHQDRLVIAGLIALDNDVEIVMTSAVNDLFLDVLGWNETDDKIALLKAMKEVYREKFAYWFNEMIEEALSQREIDEHYENGMFPYADQDTGETLWSAY